MHVFLPATQVLYVGGWRDSSTHSQPQHLVLSCHLHAMVALLLGKMSLFYP